MSYQSMQDQEAPRAWEKPTYGQRNSPAWSRRSILAAGLAALTLVSVLFSLSGSSGSSSSARVPLHSELAAKPRADIDYSICEDPMYTKKSLKTAKEVSAVAMFADPKGQKKFEASAIIEVGSYFYVVFDNLFSIGRIHTSLPFNSHKNALIGKPGVDSGFEAIFHDPASGLFYVAKESVEHPKHKGQYNAMIQAIEMPPVDSTADYTVHEECVSEFGFASENKGFEGLAAVTVGGELYALGLCEGNFCDAGKRGREPGNGRVVVMRKQEASKGAPCVWKTLYVMDVPQSANFVDYSDIAIRGDKVAITSQESSQVWIGKIDTSGPKFSLSGDKILHFPRDKECRPQYCNIEGIYFLSDTLLAAASDKMKSKGKQNFRCLDKDQSVHVFVLP